MSEYYVKGKHPYLRSQGMDFAGYIYSLLTVRNACDVSGAETAVEIGCGMGRFSCALAEHFKNVYLVEPAKDFAEMLAESFKQKGVKVFCMGAKDFFAQHEDLKGGVVFSFHVLHHVSRDERRAIFDFVKRTGSKAIFVEPNPWNPLILFQVLFTPDMKFSVEKDYLKMTKSRLINEMSKCGIEDVRHFKLCFFPPPMVSLLQKTPLKKWLSYFEPLNDLAPFFSSYSAFYCKGR